MITIFFHPSLNSRFDLIWDLVAEVLRWRELLLFVSRFVFLETSVSNSPRHEPMLPKVHHTGVLSVPAVHPYYRRVFYTQTRPLLEMDKSSMFSVRTVASITHIPC